MRTTGTSRGYGAEDDFDENDAAAAATPAHDSGLIDHADDLGDHSDHGHGVPDPTWIAPSESSFDDLYITSGGKRVDSAPVGAVPLSRLLDTLTPPPLAYRVDWLRAIVGGLISTALITPFFYFMYVGYKDNCYDIGLLLGSVFGSLGLPDGITRLLGLGVHFGVGVGLAVTYAYLLTVFRTQGNAGRGAQLGIGVCFAMMGFLFPLFVGFAARWWPNHPSFDNPDFLLQQTGPSNVGWAPMVVMLIAHLLWGALLGHIYRHKTVLVQSEHPELAPLAA